METKVIPPKFSGCYNNTDYFKKYGNTFSGLLRNLKIGEISIKYKPRLNSKDKKIKFYHIFNALYEIFL